MSAAVPSGRALRNGVHSANANASAGASRIGCSRSTGAGSQCTLIFLSPMHRFAQGYSLRAPGGAVVGRRKSRFGPLACSSVCSPHRDRLSCCRALEIQRHRGHVVAAAVAFHCEGAAPMSVCTDYSLSTRSTCPLSPPPARTPSAIQDVPAAILRRRRCRIAGHAKAPHPLASYVPSYRDRARRLQVRVSGPGTRSRAPETDSPVRGAMERISGKHGHWAARVVHGRAKDEGLERSVRPRLRKRRLMRCVCARLGMPDTLQSTL